jgi:hypothetical protein
VIALVNAFYTVKKRPFKTRANEVHYTFYTMWFRLVGTGRLLIDGKEMAR